MTTAAVEANELEPFHGEDAPNMCNPFAAKGSLGKALHEYFFHCAIGPRGPLKTPHDCENELGRLSERREAFEEYFDRFAVDVITAYRRRVLTRLADLRRLERQRNKKPRKPRTMAQRAAARLARRRGTEA